MSQPEVIDASRQFVCIRLLTYEDADEAKILRRVFTGRFGTVENSTFALLSPEGRPVMPARRAAGDLFRGAAEMARVMNDVATVYRAREPAAGRSLPLVRDVRLAVNVGACDRRPVAVITAPPGEVRRGLTDRLRDLAWQPEFLGAVVYAVAAGPEDVHHLYGLRPDSGLALVHPEEFGRWGKVVAQVPATATPAEITTAVRDTIASFPRQSTLVYDHIRAGREIGVFWDTKIPVTDREEQQVRDQTRRARPRN